MCNIHLRHLLSRKAHRKALYRTLQGVTRYLEAEDDGPDETQGEAVVPVHDVVGAHVLQVDLLLLEELQGLVHVLQAVDTHTPLSGLRLDRDKREKGERRRREGGNSGWCERVMESDMKNREGEEEGIRMKIDFMLSRMEHSEGKTTREDKRIQE